MVPLRRYRQASALQCREGRSQTATGACPGCSTIGTVNDEGGPDGCDNMRDISNNGQAQRTSFPGLAQAVCLVGAFLFLPKNIL